MTYVANSIVTVDGKEYRPGDTIQTPAVQADAASEAVTGNFSRNELETMTKANLQKLAADLGIDAAAELSKAKLIDAIASVEVGVPIQESE